MTYISFLLIFLGIPLAVLNLVSIRDARRERQLAGFKNGRAIWLAVALHVLLAVVYTTPWDNYLVARGVWYYDPKLISSILIGWVPLEEYLFFIFETMLVGLWWRFLAHRATDSTAFLPRLDIRLISISLTGAAWLAALLALFSGWAPGTYISLILAWALPAILMQLAFGADILWHYRRLLALVILPAFFYLSASDALAIFSGTWKINPFQSLKIFIGPLPLEEALFFLVTVIIISFGLTLFLVHDAQERLADLTRHVFSRNCSKKVLSK